jgi:patatin-like phospholipase/acyl hydrolase
MKIKTTDGGGGKGAKVASFLDYAPQSFSQAQMRAGTSTGSIIEAMQALNFSTKEILNKYLELGGVIFDKKPFRFGIRNAVYDNRPLIDLVHGTLKDACFGDLPKDQFLIIPAYNITQEKRCIFTNASRTKYDGVKIADAVIASSSAPRFFNAYEFGGEYYIDGGLVINNPSLVAYDEAIRLGVLPKEIDLTSFSTGYVDKDLEDIFKRWCLSDVSHLIDFMLREQQETAHLKLLDLQKFEEFKYKRVEMPTIYSNGKIDDFSKENVKGMVLDGRLAFDRMT